MPAVHVNIGSNLGDSHSLVRSAAEAISRRLGVGIRMAPPEESEPWGFSSANRFVNLGIVFESDLDPIALLDILQEVEQSISPAAHRHPDGSYADRLIDIDLIAAGNAVVDSPRLTLPHPRMHLRPFVLRPMERLQPGWVHPRLGLTPSEMLRLLSGN